jgi:hypothetical protein
MEVKRFFLQDSARLADRRDQLIFLLNNIWGRNYLVTKLLEAYDFFSWTKWIWWQTIVKDLKSIPNLDIHSCFTITYMWNTMFRLMLNINGTLIYARNEQNSARLLNMEPIHRLTLFGGLFYTNNVFFCKRMSPEQKTEMSKMVVFFNIN